MNRESRRITSFQAVTEIADLAVASDDAPILIPIVRRDAPKPIGAALRITHK
jgi:hypothetical protein